MNVYEEYKQKLVSAGEAVKLVKSGDWVDYGSNNSMPFALDAALAARKDELRRVKVRGDLIPGPIQVVECDPEMEHFVYNTWHCSSYERRMCDAGRAFFIPMLFRCLETYYRYYIDVDVAMLCVSEMDDDGYFSLGGALGAAAPCLLRAKKVILEVNSAVPYIKGGPETKVHISKANRIVEVGRRKLWEMTSPKPSETDIAIAGKIFPYIHDGATVQLGIGGLPNALGEIIAQSDLKDLGMHTELCSDGYYALHKAGKLTNAKKSLHTGKSVLGLAIGSSELYDWVANNDEVLGFPLSYVNDPAVISSMDNFISINGCLNVDLYGQVCSESSGTRQISGTGGQLDFVTGASASKGGKSFLCMSSTFTDKSGIVHSRILPKFTNGDIITTPRTQAAYIATEYGVVNLAGRSTWERAEALISIAAPQFRDGLIKAAEQQKIWLPSSKR